MADQVPQTIYETVVIIKVADLGDLVQGVNRVNGVVRNGQVLL